MIKQLLLEYHGSQADVDDISEYVANDVFDLFQQYQNNPAILKRLDNIPFTINLQKQYSSKIQNVIIILTIANNEQTNITGGFNPKKIKLNDDNETYTIEIGIKIKINKSNTENIQDDILAVVSHELHHAYREIKTLGKKSKERIYTHARNATNADMRADYNKHPELKTFMDMFYLGIQPEIDARVQETASVLKKQKLNDTNDYLIYLQRFQPINDARKMMKYSGNDLKTLDSPVLTNFIHRFNANLKYITSIEYDTVKIHTDPGAFIKYWVDRIQERGDNLFKKIMKLIFDKLNTTFHEAWSSIDLNLLENITDNYYSFGI